MIGCDGMEVLRSILEEADEVCLNEIEDFEPVIPIQPGEKPMGAMTAVDIIFYVMYQKTMVKAESLEKELEVYEKAIGEADSSEEKFQLINVYNSCAAACEDFYNKADLIYGAFLMGIRERYHEYEREIDLRAGRMIVGRNPSPEEYSIKDLPWDYDHNSN